MSTEENKIRVNHFFEEVFSLGNQEAVYELLDTSCKYLDAGVLKPIGCEEFNAYLIEPHKILYRINLEIDSIIAEGNQVAVCCSYHLMQ